MANKVEFGISQLHVGTYTVDDQGNVTLGAPYHQKGAVSFSPEEQSELTNFYADNIVYWSGYSGGSIEGDLEVAMFDDEFKTQFLGYVTLTNGGLANVKNATKPNVAIFFQVEGDKESRRVALYNCALGAITRDRLAALRESDAILREEFDKAGLTSKIWQFFTVVPDFTSTGVKDGKRLDYWPVIIRAVNTKDAMTATIEEIPYPVLHKIVNRITHEVEGINRVLMDLTPKPVGTIEWE